MPPISIWGSMGARAGPRAQCRSAGLAAGPEDAVMVEPGAVAVEPDAASPEPGAAAVPAVAWMTLAGRFACWAMSGISRAWTRPAGIARRPPPNASARTRRRPWDRTGCRRTCAAPRSPAPA